MFTKKLVIDNPETECNVDYSRGHAAMDACPRVVEVAMRLEQANLEEPGLLNTVSWYLVSGQDGPWQTRRKDLKDTKESNKGYFMLVTRTGKQRYRLAWNIQVHLLSLKRIWVAKIPKMDEFEKSLSFGWASVLPTYKGWGEAKPCKASITHMRYKNKETLKMLIYLRIVPHLKGMTGGAARCMKILEWVVGLVRHGEGVKDLGKTGRISDTRQRRVLIKVMQNIFR